MIVAWNGKSHGMDRRKFLLSGLVGQNPMMLTIAFDTHKNQTCGFLRGLFLRM